MRVWGIIGRKNVGKTTITEALIRELTNRTLTVETMKRTHHAVDLEVPGTDTHRHREAGARRVMLASDARVTLMEAVDHPCFDALVARMGPCDVLLAEGWKRGRHDRIEVWRAACGSPPLAVDDPTIRAVATEDPCDVACDRLPLSDVAAIADYLLR